jgi:hypothetical protein
MDIGNWYPPTSGKCLLRVQKKKMPERSTNAHLEEEGGNV